MSFKPIRKPYQPRLTPAEVVTQTVEVAPSQPPVPVEEPSQPTSQSKPVETTPATADSLNSNWIQPRVLTFEEVCRYLNLRPELRKFFVNKRGEYVRALVQEYTWTIDEERRVHKIPNWFIDGQGSGYNQKGNAL